MELLFMANAARLGLKVARPHGDSGRFDVIVEGGGKLHRVQVKSTVNKRGTCYPCMCSWAEYQRASSPQPAGSSSGHLWKVRRRSYTNKDADFIAAYVIPEDVWFVIPVSHIRSSGLYLPERARPDKSRYAPYVEAWHLLGVNAEGLTIHAAAETDFLLALIKTRIFSACGRQAPASQMNPGNNS